MAHVVLFATRAETKLVAVGTKTGVFSSTNVVWFAEQSVVPPATPHPMTCESIAYFFVCVLESVI